VLARIVLVIFIPLRESIGEIDAVLTPVSETEKQYYRLSGVPAPPSSSSFSYLALYLWTRAKRILQVLLPSGRATRR